MTGWPQERRPVPAQHAGVDEPVDDTIPASADVVAQTPDDLPRVPALQMLPHRVVDISKQLVAGPGISGPDCPVFRDRQPAVMASSAKSAPVKPTWMRAPLPTGTFPLSFSAVSGSISAISTTAR